MKVQIVVALFTGLFLISACDFQVRNGLSGPSNATTATPVAMTPVGPQAPVAENPDAATPVTLMTPVHQPTPTVAPGSETATPIPTRAVVESIPACNLAASLLECFDEVLGIKFRYPARWGHFVARLEDGPCGGHSYSYQFYAFSLAPLTGGLSQDDCEPDDPTITSFRGFGTEDGCELYPQAADCAYIQDFVLTATLLPRAEELCHPTPGTVMTPLMMVAVNLPPDRPVQGFVFGADFLSLKATDWLYEPLGGTMIDSNSCADADALAEFDRRAQQLAREIKDGVTDEETTYKIQQIKELAQSIDYWSPE